MIQAVYEGEFGNFTDLPTCYDVKEEEVIFAGYNAPDYEGYATVIFERDGKLWENHDSHCSCYGLEIWEPEETSVEAIFMRPDGGYTGFDGIKAAVRAWAAQR